jgi:hypothetical protein
MAFKHVLLICALVCCASAIPHFEPVDRAISALESAEEKFKSRVHDIFVNWKSKVEIVHLNMFADREAKL